jgi:hypothetical protein
MEILLSKRRCLGLINTGKVTNIVNKGDKAIVEITFMDDLRKIVVLPYEDSNKYKDKYVICAMDSDDNTKILDIVDD